MVRRIPKRSRKYLGSRHWGRGDKKHGRGSGTRGGVGGAGLGKHKWFRAIKLGLVGKRPGFFSPMRRLRLRKAINLDYLSAACSRGEWPSSGGIYQIDLRGRNLKLLGSGKALYPMAVLIEHWTPRAKEKIVKAGGSIDTGSASTLGRPVAALEERALN